MAYASFIVQAVAMGYAQRTVAHQVYLFEKGIQSGELLKVGVNIYTEGESKEVELYKYDAASAVRQR
jgi:methylmalonyl-CoA mutase N-terminal domain/subunit